MTLNALIFYTKEDLIMRKKLLKVVTVVMALICMVLPLAITASAAYYNTYADVKSMSDVNGCTSMQGMAVGSTYLYTAKVNSANTKAVLYKTNKNTGARTLLTDSASGNTYVTYLGHANDMCVTTLDDKSNLFIVTMKENSNALIRVRVDGSKFKKMGNYTVKYNGEHLAPSGVNIIKKTSTDITFLFKKGRSFYEGTIGLNQTSGTINVTKKFTINIASAVVNGKTLDLSSYTHQGYGYYKNYIFVPLTKDNVSIVLVYNIKDATGTIKTVSDLSFRITSSTYADLFEIESCGISSSDGKLYFNTNRRKVSGGTGYDAVHYFKGYTFG